MKFKLYLSLLAIGILSVSCVNKDLDLDNFDPEITIVPGLTATFQINESVVAILEEVIKQAPGYDSTLEKYRTDAQGNYKSDLLPDFSSTYSVKKDFDINKHVKGLDYKIKTLSAVLTFEVENAVAIDFMINVESDGEEGASILVEANTTATFDVVYENLIDVKEIEAMLSTSYTKGTPVTLNNNDQVKVSVKQAIITIPDGITIKL